MSIMKFLRILLNESGMEGMYQFAPGERHVELVAAQSQVASLVAAYDALAPDWSQAPEWAQWYAIDANGEAAWYSIEPMADDQDFCWFILNDGSQPVPLDADMVDIPLGVDWRLLKWQRPEVTA